MIGYAVAQVSTPWVLVGTGICTLVCLFVVSAAILGLVLFRQLRQRKGPLDVDVRDPDSPDSLDDALDGALDDVDPHQPVPDPPPPPVA